MRPILVGLTALFFFVRPVAGGSAGSLPSPEPDAITYVAGSTQKVCQLTGETDHQYETTTASQTETRYGMVGADLGYSFIHDGKLFFLVGDAMTTPIFNGQPNGPNDSPRSRLYDDAIGFTTDTNIEQCFRLDFHTNSIGAFKNPIVLDAQGQPAITLRIDEGPIAGVSANGRMYVMFMTDNYVYPSPGPSAGHLGYSTRTVVGASDDDGSTFHYLYDFSSGPNAKFINTAIAPGDGGYLYFWGSQGGQLYRHSAVYFARKPAASMDRAGGMEYYAGIGSDGSPAFSPSETDAVPLFQDYEELSLQARSCTGELGAEWNPIINRWIMLYNCAERTPTAINGIYMRTAPQPWGPWTDPQTIFNGQRDGAVCQFLHRAVTATQPACDDLSEPNRVGMEGGPYAPYFIPGYTSGDPSTGTSTFYYTMATWNPYTQVIMRTTIQGPPQTGTSGTPVAQRTKDGG